MTDPTDPHRAPVTGLRFIEDAQDRRDSARHHAGARTRSAS